jgi:hypothetical protein
MSKPNNVSVPMVLWGNRKLIRQTDPGVRQAQRNPLLAGRMLLARGVTTLVYEGQASVFKLTVDQLAYDLAEAQAKWQCTGLPGTRQLYGQVGITGDGLPIWLFEQELLERLPIGSAVRKLCMRVSKLVSNSFYRCEDAGGVLALAQPAIKDPALSAAVTHLASFATGRGERVGLDLHASNFMLRKATGQGVISDPFLDREAKRVVQEQSRLASGLPANTVFI